MPHASDTDSRGGFRRRVDDLSTLTKVISAVALAGLAAVGIALSGVTGINTVANLNEQTFNRDVDGLSKADALDVGYRSIDTAAANRVVCVIVQLVSRPPPLPPVTPRRAGST